MPHYFDFDCWSCICEIQQNHKKFGILMNFNYNLMNIQIKRPHLHTEFFHNHASKNYEIIFCKWIIVRTFQKYIQKNFMTHSRNDFDCQNERAEIQQNHKKFGISMDFCINLMIIRIKRVNLNNKFFHKHASKKIWNNFS